ncbi:MAG: type II secretion system F family protein [Holosporaceae bacterium]|jgi:type II secretory pathway component PulF|nr:type II secretion system F family protein [Holosporaceae bacterium]
MPTYKYEALTKYGFKKDGFILADNYKSAYNFLCEKQYQPMKIKKVYFSSKKITLEDLTTFFMHISSQLKCGVGIYEAIESFSDFYGNKVLSATLVNISDSLKKGESIHTAFEKCDFIFNGVIIGLLKSAENTGNIADVVVNILDFLKLQMDWKNNVKRAIAYPIFITVVALIVLIFSIGILGPQVVSLVQNYGDGEIPALTRFTINVLPRISEIICLFLPGVLAILPFFLWTKKGNNLLLRVMFRIPKIKGLIIKISMWQFCKILHIALEAKLDFVKALDLAIETVKFDLIRNELQSIRDNIEDGYKISESFANGIIIPAETLMAIYVGEEGNDLSGSLKHVSESQYQEMLFNIGSLGQILGIGLTVFTGLIFIFILCSLFYPIYSYIEIASV